MAAVQELCSALSEGYSTELQQLAAGLEAEGNPAAIQRFQNVLEALQAEELESVNMEVRQLQQLAWDNIHLGHWKDVAVVWRDLYALMCLLAATLNLANPGAPVTSETTQQQVTTVQQQQQLVEQQAQAGLGASKQQQENRHISHSILSGTGVQGALKDLDLGIMMGGPLFKPLLHAAVAEWEAQRRQHAAVQAAAAAVLAGSRHKSTAAQVAQQQQQQQQHMGYERESGGPGQLPAAKRLKHEHATDSSRHRHVDAHLSSPELQPSAAATRPEALSTPNSQGNASVQQVPAPASDLQGEAGSKQTSADDSQVLVPALGVDALQALAEASLPPGSLQDMAGAGAACLRSPVPRCHLPSLQEFAAAFMGPAQPVIITGSMEAWPAMQHWNRVQYLLHVAGHRLVPVEVGSHYLAEGWGQQLMTFEQYIQDHIQCKSASKQSITDDASKLMHTGDTDQQQSNVAATGTPLPPGAAAANAAAATANLSASAAGQVVGPASSTGAAATAAEAGTVIPSASFTAAAAGTAVADKAAETATSTAGPSTGYLAQHPLFEQIPSLARDVLTPEYCALGRDEDDGGGVQAVNAWFGPAGTVTPLHTDPPHNFLCQVVGYKYVRLYAPHHTPAMYPFTEGMNTNSSQVDLHSVDHAAFPNFATAAYQDCLLQPGEMLYIPPGWWHFVQSLTVSFSVSFWWQ